MHIFYQVLCLDMFLKLNSLKIKYCRTKVMTTKNLKLVALKL